MVATTDNIQANVGPLLCFFSIIIIPWLMFIIFIESPARA